MSVVHPSALQDAVLRPLLPRIACHMVASALLAIVGAHAQAAEPRTAWYVQGGVAEDARSLTIGASRDGRWERQYRHGQLSGQWHGEAGGWHSDRGNSFQMGVTPALRWRPDGWREGWFVEGGIGLNVVFPKYDTHAKAFSTTFNFGDHIAIGKRTGSDQRQEWSLRFQHFSNAHIKNPNPGENFLQFRYTRRLQGPRRRARLPAPPLYRSGAATTSGDRS